MAEGGIVPPPSVSAPWDGARVGSPTARCRHPKFLRHHLFGVAGQVPRAPDRRPKAPPPDPEMAAGGGVGGRSMDEGGSGHAARVGGITASGERVSALR